MTVKLGSLAFVADAVVAHLRSAYSLSGQRPTEEEAVALTGLPIIDALRDRMRPDDLPSLFGAVNESGNHAKLGVSLLRKFTDRPDVKDLLKANWASADHSLRAWMMWRILDDPALPHEWHERLFDFTMEQWTTFQNACLLFFGTPEELLPLAMRRIGDPLRPESKQWAYLCCLPIAADRDAAKAAILLRRGSPDPFMRNVAETLLEKFFS